MGKPLCNWKKRDQRRSYHQNREYVLNKPELLRQIPLELKGKTLGCWCKPLACHGDVLAEIADADNR